MFEGYDYPYISHLQIRALVQESKFEKPHQSNTYVDCEFGSSDYGKKKEVYVIELVWPSEAILYSCSLLKTIQKNRLKEAHFIFIFLIVIAYLMNCLETETSNCLMPYRHLRS